MAIAEITGSEAISTTEWSLVTDTSYAEADGSTDNGVVTLYLDLSDMVAGDQLQIRVYEDVQASGTQRIVDEWTLNGAQTNPHWYTADYTFMHQWDFTLDALAGTITVNWSIRRIPDA